MTNTKNILPNQRKLYWLVFLSMESIIIDGVIYINLFYELI